MSELFNCCGKFNQTFVYFDILLLNICFKKLLLKSLNIDASSHFDEVVVFTYKQVYLNGEEGGGTSQYH